MVKTAYFAGGIVIARDASQQALTASDSPRRNGPDVSRAI